MPASEKASLHTFQVEQKNEEELVEEEDYLWSTP